MVLAFPSYLYSPHVQLSLPFVLTAIFLFFQFWNTFLKEMIEFFFFFQVKMLLVTGQHEHCIAHLHMSFNHVFGAMTVYHQFMWMWLSLTVFSSKVPISNFHLPTNSSWLTDWLATWFVTASPLTCLKDKPRKGEKLTLSPSGTLAAITDSLGRILLLDTQALVVVRLWKVFPRHP